MQESEIRIWVACGSLGSGVPIAACQLTQALLFDHASFVRSIPDMNGAQLCCMLDRLKLCLHEIRKLPCVHGWHGWTFCKVPHMLMESAQEQSGFWGTWLLHIPMAEGQWFHDFVPAKSTMPVMHDTHSCPILQTAALIVISLAHRKLGGID